MSVLYSPRDSRPILSVIALLVCLCCSLLVHAQQDFKTTTNPFEYTTQFQLSIVADTSAVLGPVTRYPDAHEKATSFFRNQYGVDISEGGAKLPRGAQVMEGSSSTYVVNYAKVKGFPVVAGSQDLGVHDDTISVMLTEPTVVHGAYGGPNGTWAPANSVLIFGYYTFFYKNNGSVAFPRVTFMGEMPMQFMPDGTLLVDCRLKSVVWGEGMARGIVTYAFDPVENKPYVRVFSSHTYPSIQSDVAPKCAYHTTERFAYKEDFVSKWNNVLLSIVRSRKTAPPVAARAMAILNSAVDDALSTCKRKRFSSRKCSQGTLIATISHAAYRVLASLFPDEIECFTVALKRALEHSLVAALSKNDLEDIKRSAVLVADRVLRCRDNDGSNDFVDYQFSEAENAWKPTAPAYQRFPSLPQWAKVDPFAINEVSSYRQGAPPAIGSPQYEADLLEVQTLGANNSAVRTFDQRRIALFWADGAGTATPPGHWLVITQSVIRQRGLSDLYKISALFKLVSVAVADAGIVAWDHKYYYNTLRPFTAIAQRNRNSNWWPFIPTPPFPEYVSGHSTFSAAAARVLSLALGTDDIQFETVSEGYIQHVRTFSSFSSAAKEAGKSRIYGGIHFEYGNKAGFNAGVAVGNTVFNVLCNGGSCMN
ncbi:hypothetical protein C9374_007298 [Naegleria lovaniensis]|uniref:Phosphatidic acid phosphatase type 2/haloperoxidase domain-containing protein n=1 Tax=Naegleria lovaniensis TaxID=51637 RepID=A0AA88H7A8_NAELO|nr:uncharacterized protein C9374_007298 [Naegleria lovaniensis]KAG2393767.1 hypothetical protein C9374_007298 [Naegleria lovaniensis]